MYLSFFNFLGDPVTMPLNDDKTEKEKQMIKDLLNQPPPQKIGGPEDPNEKFG